MSMKTYDPKKHVITLGGLLLTGFAENKWLSAKRRAATFTLQVGSDGETVRTKINDRTGEITLTLQASSNTNDDLAALAVLDEQTGGGVGPFQCTDLNGTTVLHAPNAFVSKMPDTELAKEAGETEWMILADNMDVFRGGSNNA